MYVCNPAVIQPMKQVFTAAGNGDMVKALAILNKHKVPNPEWELENISRFIKYMKECAEKEKRAGRRGLRKRR